MALTIKRGYTTDPINKVDRAVSSSTLTNADIKDATDIVNPSLVVDVPNNAKSNYFTKTNMIYIDSFQRWYNVENIEFASANRIIYKCSCDVLKTFAGDIKSNSFFVSRQENDFDDDINDTNIPRKNQYGAPSTSIHSLGWTPNTYAYVCQIVGGVIDGGVRTYIMDEISFNGMVRQFYGLTPTTLFNSDVANNVISSVKIPMSSSDISSTSGAVPVTNVIIGNSTISVAPNCYLLVGAPLITMTNSDVTFSRVFNDWRDYENTYFIYVPYCGEMTINGADVFQNVGLTDGDGTYTVKTSVDLISGDIVTIFYQQNLLVSVPKWTLRGNCAGKASVSSNNTSNIITSSAGIITAAVGAVSGNPAALAAGITSIATTPKQISYNAGITNGVPSWALPQALTITRIHNIYQIASNFAHTYGKPANKTISGSVLSGFTKCENVQMTWSDSPSPTESEKERVKSMLESGVIF